MEEKLGALFPAAELRNGLGPVVVRVEVRAVRRFVCLGLSEGFDLSFDVYGLLVRFDGFGVTGGSPHPRRLVAGVLGVLVCPEPGFMPFLR